MIRFTNVSLMRGLKPLLEGADLTLNPGDKIGLIGANGAGKSSLFAMLRDELHPDQGSIDFPAKWRMAYVAQETPPLPRAALLRSRMDRRPSRRTAGKNSEPID